MQDRHISVGDWKVSSQKRPILKSDEAELASQKLQIPLPEICFGHNLLCIEHRTFKYTFDAIAALEHVDKTGSHSIKVAHAEVWSQSRTTPEEALTTVKNFDWTYTTTFQGDCNQVFRPAPPDHPGIPLHKLASQSEKILFYEEIPLFEDELHDCGISDLTVRIRVMPSCLFILSRFFLRVDKVTFRVFDVRLYHEFGSKEVLRESKGREQSYDAIKQMLPRKGAMDLSLLSDVNWVANKLGMISYNTASTEPLPALPWLETPSQLEICRLE